MPIAYAARISISLPTFFNTCAWPVKIWWKIWK
jgi:hypothetical protein